MKNLFILMAGLMALSISSHATELESTRGTKGFKTTLNMSEIATNEYGDRDDNCKGTVKVDLLSGLIWIEDSPRSRVEFKVCSVGDAGKETCAMAIPQKTKGKKFAVIGDTTTGTRSTRHYLPLFKNPKQLRLEVKSSSIKKVNACYGNFDLMINSIFERFINFQRINNQFDKQL